VEARDIDRLVRALCEGDEGHHLTERMSHGEAADVIADLYVAHQDAVRRLPVVAEELGHEIACQRGCHECCYELVLVTAAEAHVMALELLRPENAVLLERFEAQADDWLDASEARAQRACVALAAADWPTYLEKRREHHRARQLCPLNQDGECTLYDARPLRCRSAWVVDSADRCGPDVEPRPQLVSYPAYEQFLAMTRRLSSGLQEAVGRPGERRQSLPYAVCEELARLRAGVT